jgi:hypothetical protein
VLGILVKEENKEMRDENSKVLVANHISPCDHIAVHLMCGSFTVSAVAHSVCSLCVVGKVVMELVVLYGMRSG